MKNIVIVCFLSCICSVGIPLAVNAQITEIVDAVIEAIDVGVQKAQNAVIDLQNAQKDLENDLSNSQLGQIGSWVQQHKNLFAEYYNELKTVKDAITDFNRVKQIISEQVELVNEYKQAYSLYQQDSHFSPQELQYMMQVYTGIVNSSLRNLDQLYLVITSLQTEMTDGKRVAIINDVARGIDGNLNDLRGFNSQNSLLSVQRAGSEEEVIRLKTLYGLQ